MSSPRLTIVVRRASLNSSRSSSGQLVERLEGVDRLGHRDPHPGLAQQVRELDDLLLHGGPRDRGPRAGRLVENALLGAAGWRATGRGSSGGASAAFCCSSLPSSALGLLDVALVLEDDVQGVLDELAPRACRR